jgi:hypothetical protein
MHGTHGAAFGTILGTIHSGITHIATTQDITHTRHIDHIHTRLITLIILIHHITLTTLAQILIMVQTIITVQITMALKMLIAEIITVMATQEATKHALRQTQIQETQMAMFHAQQTMVKDKETQIVM